MGTMREETIRQFVEAFDAFIAGRGDLPEDLRKVIAKQFPEEGDFASLHGIRNDVFPNTWRDIVNLDHMDKGDQGPFSALSGIVEGSQVLLNYYPQKGRKKKPAGHLNGKKLSESDAAALVDLFCKIKKAMLIREKIPEAVNVHAQALNDEREQRRHEQEAIHPLAHLIHK